MAWKRWNWKRGGRRPLRTLFRMTLLARRWRRGERHKFNQVMMGKSRLYIQEGRLYRRADYTGELLKESYLTCFALFWKLFDRLNGGQKAF